MSRFSREAMNPISNRFSHEAISLDGAAARVIASGQMASILCIVGWSRSGKTTLIERLLQVFRGRGVRVATVKHHPKATELDTPGKDTDRHLKAGAERVVLLSPGGFGLFGRTEEEVPLGTLVARHLGEYDLVLAEGFKGGPYPKVEVYRREMGSRPLAETERGILAVVSDTPLSLDLPCFGPEEVEALADFIQGRLLKGGGRISLLVNGQVVPINPFVQRLLQRLTEAMVTPLRGCEDAREVVIHWRKG